MGSFGGVFLIALLIIIQAFCIVLCILCIKLTKKRDIEYLSKFLKKFIIILLIVTGIGYLISLVAGVLTYKESPLMIVLLFKSIIEAIFLGFIGYSSINFYNHLINNIIFDRDNSKSLMEIGKAFLYYALVEAIAGITLAIVNNIISSDYGFDYTITISSNFFMCLFLGVVFYLISILFDRSIEIYEENQLTI